MDGFPCKTRGTQGGCLTVTVNYIINHKTLGVVFIFLFVFFLLFSLNIILNKHKLKMVT